MDASRSTPELFAALADAQAEVENASKNSANPHFKSKYADLAEVLNTVRPVFSKHGLSVLQSTEFDGARVSVTTAIAHKSGGIVTSTAACVPAKTDAQGVGSATTYLRRYSLAAMAGVAQEDDDGNAAAHNKRPAKAPEQANKVSPLDGVLDGLGDEELAFLNEQASRIVSEFKENGASSAAALYYRDLHLTQEEQLCVWKLMAPESTARNQIKKCRDQFVKEAA